MGDCATTPSSQAAPATAVAIGSDMAPTSETIAGVHVFRVDNFSASKDLGVGKSIKSSTFRVGGHDWYIECYPCGVHGGSAGWVHLKLCRQQDHHGSSRVMADCNFELLESPKENFLIKFEDEDMLVAGIDFIKGEELESLLKDDSFRVRCVVRISKLPSVAPRDLASETVAGGSHVLTIEEYSKNWQVFDSGDSIESCSFHALGLCWCIEFFPRGQCDAELCAFLELTGGADDKVQVDVLFEFTLLTHAGQIISSPVGQTFSEAACDCYFYEFLCTMQHESSPFVQVGVQIRPAVKGMKATPHIMRRSVAASDLQGGQRLVNGDVTFEVGGHLFAAHRCVLATRCTGFMAEFFGPAAGNENTDHNVRINGVVPRVFQALLHFIYTDALPAVREEEDKVGMAQGLLVAADRYALERLKLICGDLLCAYINNARTAVTTRDLADKHGCRRLKEVCIKFLMDQFANNVAP